MADFKLSRIGIVMLGVQDIARSLAFYRDTLGVGVQGEVPGFAFLDGGGMTLALSKPLADAYQPTVGAVELVFNVEAVRAACRELQATGVVFVNEPRNVNGRDWAANFADPDGHHLSIFGPEGDA